MKKILFAALAAAMVVGCSNRGTGGSGDQGQIAQDRQNVAQTERENERDMANTQNDANHELADQQKQNNRDMASAQNDANAKIADQEKTNNERLSNAEQDLKKDQHQAYGNYGTRSQGSSDHLTAQAGVVTGRVTDLDDHQFTVKVPDGDSVKIQKPLQAGSTFQTLTKGEEVRASFKVDSKGDKIGQDVTVIRAAPATTDDTK
jgi:hypothetical protein